MKRYAQILSAMANAKRLEVLRALITSEMSVTSLADRVGLSQSALSQHLAKLRAAKIVSTRRDVRTIYYSVSSPVVSQILTILEAAYGQAVNVSARPEAISA